MNELEHHYRAGLRWYTAAWRRHNGEALLGTLIETAEANGQTKPTTAEMRNLARTGLCQRARSAVPYILFGIALLGLLSVISMLAAGVGPQRAIILRLPAIPPPRLGELYSVPSTPEFSAAWVYIAGAVLFVLGSTIGTLMLRRYRLALTSTRRNGHQ